MHRRTEKSFTGADSRIEGLSTSEICYATASEIVKAALWTIWGCYCKLIRTQSQLRTAIALEFPPCRVS
jgi:hypothetical protein